ncbi:MAG TPA: apolipoprotein N-acyltransferase [Mycobacteriales bacterium]|nr:apolipoprotein N-acyltransferase [Mycobacteriales bacterium]
MAARVRHLARPVVAAGAGLLLWTSFPPLDWWPAAYVAIAALALLTHSGRRRAAAVTGYAFGLGLFVPMLAFLRGLGVDAWLVLAAIEACWFALLAVALRHTAGLRWWPVAVPVLWVGQEWLRDRWPFGGFPWGRVAFGQADSPLLPLASLGGAVLVTFAAAVVGAALAGACRRLSVADGRRTASAGVLGAAAVCALALAAPAALPIPTAGTSAGGRSHAVVAVVQGNVPRLGLREFEQARAVTVNHMQETQALAADVAAGRVPRPDAVIWPENASDMDPYTDAQARQLIDTAVAAVGVPVLVGAVLDGPGPRHVTNAAIVWSPQTGPGERYAKRHLVPFGEYLPMRALLTKLVGRFSLIARDFVPGHRPGLLQVGPVRVADVICFEVADDGVVRDAVDAGGRLITVQTNNATYERPGDDGSGGETAQQLQMSRLRAVEHGRAVVVAATSGVSAVIAPDGRVLQRSGVFTPARLVADVPLRDPMTVADRLGAWPERALAILAALVIVAATVRGRWVRASPVVTAPPRLHELVGRR